MSTVAYKTRSHGVHTTEEGVPSREEAIKALAPAFMAPFEGKQNIVVNLSAPQAGRLWLLPSPGPFERLIINTNEWPVLQVVLAAEALVIGGQTFCALSLLPKSLVTLKPRLGVRTLRAV